MSENLTKNVKGLNDSVKDLVKIKIDLFKLSALKKMSVLFSHLFGLLVINLLSMMILMFGAAAFSVWYGETTGNLTQGFLISAGFLVFLAIIAIALRKRIFTNELLRRFSDSLFEKDK